MNTKTIPRTPSQGELAEQRHLVDPLDHVLEHLADERHPASARDELRDCFLSDSRDRFEAAADAYRAEVLREAADMIVTENDRMLWATKPGRHWTATFLRCMANAATSGGAR